MATNNTDRTIAQLFADMATGRYTATTTGGLVNITNGYGSIHRFQLTNEGWFLGTVTTANRTVTTLAGPVNDPAFSDLLDEIAA